MQLVNNGAAIGNLLPGSQVTYKGVDLTGVNQITFAMTVAAAGREFEIRALPQGKTKNILLLRYSPTATGAQFADINVDLWGKVLGRADITFVITDNLPSSALTLDRFTLVVGGTPHFWAGDTTSGKRIFTATCAACHDLTAADHSIKSSYTRETLRVKINKDMPSPTECLGQCAMDVAAYLWQVLPDPNVAVPLDKVTLRPETYLRKAKGILIGLPPTAAELAQIKQDPTQLAALVKTWMLNPLYSKKLGWFLTNVLQSSDKVSRTSIASQIINSDAAGSLPVTNKLFIYDNITQYVQNTVMDIIAQDRPFTEIITTEQWQMTPALMSFFIASDAAIKGGPSLQIAYNDCSHLTVTADTPIADQISKKQWCVPWADPQNNQSPNGFKLTHPGYFWARLEEATEHAANASNAPFVAADFTTWKKVTIKAITANTPAADIIPFYDLPRLRSADTIYVRVPRPGFFTSMPFLAKWRTNDDNQFRVVTNQMLVVALGQAITNTDTSVPLSSEGLDPIHAADPDCQSCHKLLDPMRSYFTKVFNADFSRPLDVPNNQKPTFSFDGHTSLGGYSLTDLATTLASHPSFAEGWVQKLCYYANSQACETADPAFKTVAEDFRGSGFKFSVLMSSFFSSDLITKKITTQNGLVDMNLTSVSRRQHFCFNLAARLNNYAGDTTGSYSPCDDKIRKINLISAVLPEDEWARGAVQPGQPSMPDMFYYAATENICYRTALNKLGTKYIPMGNFTTFKTYLMENLMGIPKGDALYIQADTLLTDHFNATNIPNATLQQRYASVFSLGCSSPFLTSLDY